MWTCPKCPSIRVASNGCKDLTAKHFPKIHPGKSLIPKGVHVPRQVDTPLKDMLNDYALYITEESEESEDQESEETGESEDPKEILGPVTDQARLLPLLRLQQSGIQVSK